MATISVNNNGITQYIDDSGIQFTNIDLTGGYKTADGNKFTGKNSMFLPDNAENGTITGKDTRKFINAVDIDWNGADLSSATSSFANAADTAPVSSITTTGELMKDVYSPMFAKAA